MKRWALCCLCTSLVMLSGCSYIGSFLICNFSGAEIRVTYRTRGPMSSMHLFSNAPDVFRATLHGDKVKLGNDTLIPFHWNEGITINIPSGFALNTGDDVNAWMHEKEYYADLEELFIVQGTDTTKLTGLIMPSFVRDLGCGKGLIIR